MREELRIVKICLYMIVGVLFLSVLVTWVALTGPEMFYSDQNKSITAVAPPPDTKPASARPVWSPPDTLDIPDTPEGDLIRYGRELVAHTAVYLGPYGTVRRISNGMNCQNCHLSAGKKPFGNNYAAVRSTYPKFRARSGTVETVEKRVNDCIERSLNGQKLEDTSLEMRSFVAYIKWVGKDVPDGETPPGAGIAEIKPLDRPADPLLGKKVFETHCQVCHGIEGRGIRHENGVEWKYPPLHGDSSYNTGAGLYRLSRFAGYVKANMPYGITYETPVLTDEEAWDVAAYINSLPRPVRDLSRDWPDISKKPYDHPFGPFADTFPESQHKYGPFGPIKEAAKRNARTKPGS